MAPNTTKNGAKNTKTRPKTHLEIRNYRRYQHYKDRRPPWVKLYVDILVDDHFNTLTNDARLLAILLLCVAANRENKIPDDHNWIATECGFKPKTARDAIAELLAANYLTRASTTASKNASPTASTNASNPASENARLRARPRAHGEAETENVRGVPTSPLIPSVAEPEPCGAGSGNDASQNGVTGPADDADADLDFGGADEPAVAELASLIARTELRDV